MATHIIFGDSFVRRLKESCPFIADSTGIRLGAVVPRWVCRNGLTIHESFEDWLTWQSRILSGHILPRDVIISIGGNDLSQGKRVDVTFNRLRFIIEDLRTHGVGTVHVIEIPPRTVVHSEYQLKLTQSFGMLST